MSTYWIVKNGGAADHKAFKTLKVAREYAKTLNAENGFDFTIIEKITKPKKPLLIERELSRLFSR